MRIPKKENYSIRCPISHRPDFMTRHPVFYRCPHCGALTILHVPNTDPAYPSHVDATCCGRQVQPLIPCTDPSLIEEHRIDYTLFGGFEKNAAQISICGGIHPMTEEHSIEWVYIYGFQGGQLKYLTKGRQSRANFAFADEDAYAYCDRPVCKMGREHCQFQCKRDLKVYAYCSRHGLYSISL